jgi:cytochrome b561
MTEATPPATRRYNTVAKALHWAIALLIVAQFAIAWTMPEVHKGTLPVGEIAWHIIVGVTILLLVAARIVWRIVRPPVTVGVDSGLQHRIAQLTHGLLYLCMVVVPLLGWANANARDWAVGLCTGFRLPKIMASGDRFGLELGDVHGTLATVMLVLVGLHVAAGLYHHVVLKDDTLQRMR